jgi:Tol biopolymer transport system component
MGYSKAALACLVASTLIGAKPPSGSVDPQVAYVILTGPGFEVRVSNEDGTNLTTLYKSPAPVRMDLAPRGQRQIALTDDKALKLLTYGVNGSGAFVTTGVQTLYTDATRLYYVDMSPNGRKITFAANNGQDLMVYDLDQAAGPSNPQKWTTTSYVWDLTWFRNGNAIAFVVPASSTQRYDLYEIGGPGETPTLIHSERNIDMLDASRTNANGLVLSYNDLAGNALIGLWEAPTASDPDGGYLQTNLTNRSVAFKGSLNCDDSKLAYGAPDKNGQTVWYIRNLNQNSDRLYTKTPRVNWTQFWPTC